MFLRGGGQGFIGVAPVEKKSHRISFVLDFMSFLASYTGHLNLMGLIRTCMTINDVTLDLLCSFTGRYREGKKPSMALIQFDCMQLKDELNIELVYY